MSAPEEDIKLEALAKQRAERDKVLEDLFPQHLDGIRKLRQERSSVECLNPYEKNAEEVNDLMFFVDEDQFAQLPNIDARTVFRIVKRVLRSEEKFYKMLSDSEKAYPSFAKKVNKEYEWKPYIAEFDRLKSENDSKNDKDKKTQSNLLMIVGDKIEKDRNKTNKEYIDAGKKPPFKLRKIKDIDKPTTRPDESTLLRQLVLNRK